MQARAQEQLSAAMAQMVVQGNIEAEAEAKRKAEEERAAEEAAERAAEAAAAEARKAEQKAEAARKAEEVRAFPQASGMTDKRFGGISKAQSACAVAERVLASLRRASQVSQDVIPVHHQMRFCWAAFHVFGIAGIAHVSCC